MEKHLIKLLIVAFSIMGISMYYFGIIMTGIALFNIALVFFIVGLIYIFLTAIKQSINDIKRGL
jgi:hypothetical protein